LIFWIVWIIFLYVIAELISISLLPLIRSDTASVVLRPALARLGYERAARRWTVYSPNASGVVYVVATRSGVTDSVRVRVVVDTTAAPPPPPPPPTLPPVVTVPAGWAATVDSLLGPIPDCGAVRASSDATLRLCR
jgi:hypothetical protein